MKLKKWEIALLITFIFSLVFCLAMKKDSEALSGKLIRLHVIANSDSQEDVALKLDVRDAVLEQAEKITAGVKNKNEAAGALTDGLNALEKAAKGAVQAAGYDYATAVTLSEEYYPTREYETFSLPAGTYTSLRITIGKGNGHNWWCVVFPPICTQAATCEEFEELGLTEGQASLITADSGQYAVRFKIIELIEKLLQTFK